MNDAEGGRQDIEKVAQYKVLIRRKAKIVQRVLKEGLRYTK